MRKIYYETFTFNAVFGIETSWSYNMAAYKMIIGFLSHPPLKNRHFNGGSDAALLMFSCSQLQNSLVSAVWLCSNIKEKHDKVLETLWEGVSEVDVGHESQFSKQQLLNELMYQFFRQTNYGSITRKYFHSRLKHKSSSLCPLYTHYYLMLPFNFLILCPTLPQLVIVAINTTWHFHSLFWMQLS